MLLFLSSLHPFLWWWDFIGIKWLQKWRLLRNFFLSTQFLKWQKHHNAKDIFPPFEQKKNDLNPKKVNIHLVKTVITNACIYNSSNNGLLPFSVYLVDYALHNFAIYARILWTLINIWIHRSGKTIQPQNNNAGFFFTLVYNSHK